METAADRREVFRTFAELLEYPGPGLARAAAAGEDSLRGWRPAAADLLHDFRSFVDATPPGRLEEVYTTVFDLSPGTPPYLGHYLFGESYKRSVFLLELGKRYRAAGFSAGTELADHIAVVLRFLATAEDRSLADELVRDAILPVLATMAKGDDDPELRENRRRERTAYRQVLEALRLALREESDPVIPAGGVVRD